MGQAEDKDHNAPGFDPAEKQKIQRANQIFLRLRKELHDREMRFSERDVREAAQGARWLREIIERYPGDWEQAYEAALAESDLAGEDDDYLRKGVREAGGFLPFTRSNLRRLEEAAPGESEQTGDPVGETTRQGFLCGVAASIVAGGVMTGNSFYFGFGVGISRKADCW
jgi:predicted DNA-binding protein